MHYDYAILELGQNELIKKKQVLTCNFEYFFQNNSDGLINIPGYPAEKNLKKIRNKFSGDNAAFYE